MRARYSALALGLLLSGCGSKTFVTLALQAGPAMPTGIQRIDLDLSLGGKRASAQLNGPGGGAITLPTDTVLAIANGEGELSISAIALDAAQNVLAQGSTVVTVVRDQTTAAILAFGEDRTGTDGGTDSSVDAGDPRCAVCSPVAVCDTSGPTVTCTCPTGYTGDGATCTDIDECAGGTAGCDPNATCTNKPGDFVCACKPGYSGDGKLCKEVWLPVIEIPSIDLLSYGNATGTPTRIYLGNEANPAANRYFKSVNVTTSPPLVTDVPQMVDANSQWCTCGGCSGSSLLQTEGNRRWLIGCGLHYFDTSTETWNDISGGWAPLARTRAAVGLIGSLFYVIGGNDYTASQLGTLKTVAAVNVAVPTAPSFPPSGMPDYPIVVEAAGSFVAGDKIYVFGGQTKVGSQTQETKKFHVLNPAGGGTWTALPDITFSTQRSYLSPYTAVYKNRARVFDDNDRMQTFDVATQAWDPTPVSSPPGSPNNGSGWIPVVAGTPEQLYIVNYLSNAGTVKVVVYRYGLE